MEHVTADGLDYEDVYALASREDMTDIAEPKLQKFQPSVAAVDHLGARTMQQEASTSKSKTLCTGTEESPGSWKCNSSS